MRTSKQNFIYFKSQVFRWISYFGLKKWEIHFEHSSDKANKAYVYTNSIEKHVIFGLSTTWEFTKRISNEALSKTAFHEVCELLLTPLAGDTPSISKMSKVHDVIHVLENTIFLEKWSSGD